MKISSIFTAAAVLVWLWFAASVADVVLHNLEPVPAYAVWNFFTLII